MTEYLLTLIPQYGIYLIFTVVFFACLGIPLPSSVLVLTSGAFSAAGDLEMMQAIATIVIAYCLADQIAFTVARLAGPALLLRMRRYKRISPLVDKSDAMLHRHGWLAVFLSHTILSPADPTVSYVSGAIHMNWLKFTTVATASATLWTLAYFMLGYIFAGELPQISDLVVNMLIAGATSLCAIGLAIWLSILWRHFEAAEQAL